MGKLLFTILVVFCISSIITGQQSTKISGTVTDNQGTVLPGANILIPALNLGAATNEKGKYEFTVPAKESNGKRVDMTVRYVGYKSQTVAVILSGKNIEQNFSLEEDIFQSEDVVVTGIASKTAKGTAEVSVSRLNAANYSASNSYQTISQLINGKVSGVQMGTSSGNVGGEFSFYMRGGGGINGNEQPIIYVDGVRINNDETGIFWAGGQNNLGSANLNPEDIDKIEILKGPAGAATYGTQGSNGVVLITTKSGAMAPANKGISVNYKFNYGYNDQSYKYSTGNFLSANNANANFVKGFIREHSINVTGGSEALNYYGGFTSRTEGGIMPNNGFDRESVRANITAYPNENFVIRLNGSFNYTNINRPQNDNSLGAFLGNTLDTPPPSYRSVDSASIMGVTTTSKVNQFIGNVDISYYPVKNLEIEATAGVDNRNTRDDQNYPIGLLYPILPNREGERDLGNGENKQFTYTINGRYSFSLFKEQLKITSVAGAQLFNREQRFSFMGSNNFATGLITNIGAGTNILYYDEGYQNTRTAGIYTEHSLAYQNKYFLTLGLRRDYASVIGLDAPNIYYPKASFAVRLDKMGFFPSSLFNLFKIRTAYGETGTLPDLTDGISLLWSSVVGGYGSGAILASIGNPEIKPERIKELELGFDAEFLDIFSFEFTYYQQHATNSIVGLRQPPSTGLTATPVPFNIGAMKNHGFESLLKADLFRTSDYGINAAMIWNYQNNEVTSLGGAQPIFDGYNMNVIKEGLPKHEFYMPVVKGALFDANGNYAGPDVSTEKYDLGNPVANWSGSFSVNCKFLKNFNLYALFDWQLGRKVLNLTAAWAASLGNYAPFNQAQQRLANATPGTQEYIDAANAFAKMDGNYFSNYIEPAGFFKFRELSLSYRLTDLLKEYLTSHYISDLILGISGRNLWTKTPYSGADPELNFEGGRTLTRGIDFFTLEHPRTYNVWVKVAF